jgi:hypothetical protein
LIGYDAAPNFSGAALFSQLNGPDLERVAPVITPDPCCKSTLRGARKARGPRRDVAQIIAKLLSIWLNSPLSSVN